MEFALPFALSFHHTPIHSGEVFLDEVLRLGEVSLWAKSTHRHCERACLPWCDVDGEGEFAKRPFFATVRQMRKVFVGNLNIVSIT